MSAHGLLSSVFSCSSNPRSSSRKRRLRHTRSSDPVLMRHDGGTDQLLEADFTWSSVSGRTVDLKPVPLQSLSELERAHLQEVAFRRLLGDRNLGRHVTIPKYGHKRKKSLRRKLDSLSKDRAKDKEITPQVFGLPLSDVISADHTQKRRHSPQREAHSDPTELMLSFLHLTSSYSRRATRELSSSNSSLSSASETPCESPPLRLPDVAPRTHRRGGVSVDCITDLDDNQSQLLEALQLSLPVEGAGSRKKRRDKKLSLNPIYRQVPRVVDLCCQHLERHALQTVGIFRIGSSKKRVRQLREEFDQGWEVQMEEENGVHDVAALLKEFFRDLPDPLLTRDLYTAFLSTTLLDPSEQEHALQLLIFLLPPCNSDTLHRLLCLLATVAAHAEDSLDSVGQEIPGNKMTSLNLATIFGPNLLHKTKNPDKEFTVESLARAEESVAVISVLQRLIEWHDALFTVSADLQNELLVNLLDTDPDVVDHLLRRKASQHSEPNLLRVVDTFPLTERCSSSDSVRASSGELSPYDNNSLLMSEEPLYRYPADADPQPMFSPFHKQEERSGGTSSSLSADKGSLGDTSECESLGSSEGLSSRQGNSVLLVRAAQSSLGAVALEARPHPPVTRSSSGPREQRGRPSAESPLHQLLRSQSGALSTDDLRAPTGSRHACPLLKVRTHSLSGLNLAGQLRETRISRSTPSLLACRPRCPSRSPAHSTHPAPPHTDKWQMWRTLSKESPDALPETLV